MNHYPIQPRAWIEKNPTQTESFKQAYADRTLSNAEIAQMFNMPFEPAGEGKIAASPYVSRVAKLLNCPMRRTHLSTKETTEQRIYRLKKELADAEKEKLQMSTKDEERIRKIVADFGGKALFLTKLHGMKGL